VNGKFSNPLALDSSRFAFALKFSFKNFVPSQLSPPTAEPLDFESTLAGNLSQPLPSGQLWKVPRKVILLLSNYDPHIKMALDPLLFGTYKRYKAGTSRVTTWLASKAKDMNLSNNLFPVICGNKGKGRLKGKARAAQKENGQTYQVALADIPRIAEAIASKSKVTVPGRIIQTLEEVIAARTACNACFE
jgi:hypothetical protein